jgi:hypothetical protein
LDPKWLKAIYLDKGNLGDERGKEFLSPLDAGYSDLGCNVVTSENELYIRSKMYAVVRLETKRFKTNWILAGLISLKQACTKSTERQETSDSMGISRTALKLQLDCGHEQFLPHMRELK